MARSEGQKLKLLYLVRLLEECSDEHHPVSTQEIVTYLETQGIHSERKSIYDDIRKLEEFGYDIIHVQNRLGGGYYLADREFELPELKLLVDAVQSSRFITTKKSRELIKKLEQKVSKYDAGKLQRQVYVAGRAKTENESIYYNIDNIHRAIQENKQIQFQYLDWNLKKELVPRSNAARTVSPWALIWQVENYYLAAYDAEDGLMKHYRVDKMGSVRVLEQDRCGIERFREMDLASYTNQTFGMFGGVQETVALQFPDKLIGVVLDRFGREADIRSLGEGTFRVRVKVAVSGQFFGWLTGIGREVHILSPDDVREKYHDWLQGILESSGNE
ncbi:MAG: WYL domain-containing protein [Lachnospiraceae bacterium]|nr:WYL domain-containing protein [Lachnospiraceae bacterium]